MGVRCWTDAGRYRSSPRFAQLTSRELEIMLEMTAGRSNKSIAERLQISPGTVKIHVRSIFKKLDVHSRIEVAVMVARQGMG